MAELARAMDSLVVFLRDGTSRPGAWSDRITFWANWVAADAERVRAGDYGGVDHFLMAFGGMGSLNDLAVGVGTDDDRQSRVEVFDGLKQRAWDLANAMRRNG